MNQSISEEILKEIEELLSKHCPDGERGFQCRMDRESRLKELLQSKISQAITAERKELIEKAVEVINEAIRNSNPSASVEWYNGLRCARESVKSLIEEK